MIGWMLDPGWRTCVHGPGCRSQQSFFFQAEDGIRDLYVTGVQTCALPIYVLPSRRSGPVVSAMLADPRVRKLSFTGSTEVGRTLLAEAAEHVVNCSMELGGNAPFVVFARSEERRVGKEGRCWWSPYHEKKR